LKGRTTITAVRPHSEVRRSTGGRGFLTISTVAQAWVVLVIFSAAVLTTWFVIIDPARGAHLYIAGILGFLTVAYLEFTSRLEKRRRLLNTKSSTMNMNSVWMLPAAVLLPPGLAAAFIALVCLHTWLRVGRAFDQPGYRAVYSVSAYVLPSVAIAVTLRALGFAPLTIPNGIAALGAIAVAIVIFRVGNTALISVAVLLTSPSARKSALFGSRFENGLEFGTLVLGGITAVCLAREPWLAILVPPAVFLLQHHALIRELVEAATTDVKTELLNAASWRQLAEQELATARRRKSNVAVFVIDMDHFKRINDEYGHLGGDAALRAVGEALAEEFRGYDAVGRFGGEEFVALVPGVDMETASGVAERVRRRIESLRITSDVISSTEPLTVTASIGVVVRGSHGDTLDELLHAADRALYVAKNAGRNAVCLADAAQAVKSATDAA
jgi:diguanylate cyclase (GGDEF)-like protein